MDRRSFVRTSAFSGTLFAAAGFAALSPTLPDAASDASGRRQSVEDAQRLRALLAEQRRLDEIEGGGSMRHAVIGLLRDVAQRLDRPFDGPAAKNAMMATASDIAYLAGWKCHDVGDERGAQILFRRCRELAVEAGDAGQAAWALRITALQALHVGATDRGVVDLTQQAYDEAKGVVDGETFNLFRVALARCLAEVGEFRAARAHLRVAEDLVDDTPSPERPMWADGWFSNNAALFNQISLIFRSLREGPHEQQWLRRASAARDEHVELRALALGETNCALSLWRQGMESEAADMWDQWVPVLRNLESSRAHETLERIRTEAPEYAITS